MEIVNISNDSHQELSSSSSINNNTIDPSEQEKLDEAMKDSIVDYIKKLQDKSVLHPIDSRNTIEYVSSCPKNWVYLVNNIRSEGPSEESEESEKSAQPTKKIIKLRIIPCSKCDLYFCYPKTVMSHCIDCNSYDICSYCMTKISSNNNDRMDESSSSSIDNESKLFLKHKFFANTLGAIFEMFYTKEAMWRIPQLVDESETCRCDDNTTDDTNEQSANI